MSTLDNAQDDSQAMVYIMGRFMIEIHQTSEPFFISCLSTPFPEGIQMVSWGDPSEQSVHFFNKLQEVVIFKLNRDPGYNEMINPSDWNVIWMMSPDWLCKLFG